jgi:hypothetical protein
MYRELILFSYEAAGIISVLSVLDGGPHVLQSALRVFSLPPSTDGREYGSRRAGKVGMRGD